MSRLLNLFSLNISWISLFQFILSELTTQSKPILINLRTMSIVYPKTSFLIYDHNY